MRAQIEALPRCGEEGMSEELRKARNRLRRVPQNDSIAEGPRAIIGRLMCHARGSKWAWNASSLRLGQNLKDLRNWKTMLGLDLQNMWDTWSSIVKARRGTKRYMERPVRKPRLVVLDAVYHMQLDSLRDEPGPRGADAPQPPALCDIDE